MTTKLSLTPARVQGLTIVTNPHDLRRDLHKYIQYVRERNIKRSYRGNELPSADVKRLSQLLNLRDNTPAAKDHYNGDYSWLDYVERVARKLGFVSYDTKGEYRGYSSSEPTFRENYIVFKAEVYQKFINLSLVEQEHRLFDTLVDDYTYNDNEFYQYSPLGSLNHFSQRGSAIGVMPTLNFANIRRNLFNLLYNSQTGEWYSTASLVNYLKTNEPYFLIPASPKIERWGNKVGRYDNFYEDSYLTDKTVPENAPDGFERVEGRYIERFLEGIPLTLGYVEVAYQTSEKEQDRYVSRGELVAFRLTERFFQARSGNIPAPRVVVQPTFEILVESAFYPARLVEELNLLADVIKEDSAITTFKLQKQKVATQAAQNATFDPVETLQKLVGKALPQNVAYELREWTRRAEVFTLYDGFGLLEAETTQDLAAATPFVVENISANLKLVQWPEGLRDRLREAGEVVLYVRHEVSKLERLPEKSQTVFPRETVARKIALEKAEKRPVTIKQEVLLALSFPNDELFEKFRKALLDAHCALEANKEKRQLTLSNSYQSQIQQVIEKLSEEYTIRLEETG
jgi:hypothetical protein